MSNIVALKTGGAIAGIVPTNIEEAYRVATAVHKSGLAPRDMNTAEKLLVAIMHGLEIGLPPMQAIQRIAVVNGRPTMWGDAIPALLQARNFRLVEKFEGEGDARAAVCQVIRPDKTSNEARFSVTDAKQAGLWGKPGPWKQYPDRMLQMRARGFAARDGAADVLMGLYLREEIEDEEATAPKSAYKARKDGDFEKLTSALASCATEDDIETALANHSELLDKIPRKWHEHVNEHVEAARKRVTAVTVEAIIDEPDDDTTAARRDIKTAINVEMLEHLRQVYADADWEVLAADYDERLEALQAVQG